MGGGYNEFSSSKTGIRQLQNIRLNSSLRNNLASNNFNRYSANNNQRNNGGRGEYKPPYLVHISPCPSTCV